MEKRLRKISRFLVAPRRELAPAVCAISEKKSGLLMEVFRKGSDPHPPPYFRKLWNP